MTQDIDIRLLVSFKGHIKRKKLKHLIGPESDTYLIDFWLTVATDRPSGELKKWGELEIAWAAGYDGDPKKFTDAMLEAGWIEKNGDGNFRVHDWHRHQGWTMGREHRSMKATISALIRHYGRKKGLQCAIEQYQINPEDYGFELNYGDAGSNANSMPAACQLHAGSNAPSPSPNPSPNPIPIPKDKTNELPKGNSSTNPSGLQTEDEKKPEDDKEKIDPPDTPPCPHKQIISIYHKTLPELPKIRIWDETSSRQLKTRWREDPIRQNIEFWQEYFDWVKKSKFLMGHKTEFQADLHWLVRPSNFAKVVNGRYHNRNNTFHEKLRKAGEEWLKKKDAEKNS